MFFDIEKRIQNSPFYKFVVDKLDNIERRLTHVDEDFVKTELYADICKRFESIDEDFSKTPFAATIAQGIGNLTEYYITLLQRYITLHNTVKEMREQLNELIALNNIVAPCVEVLSQEYNDNHVSISLDTFTPISKSDADPKKNLN